VPLAGPQSTRRVVITGMSVICPLGSTLEAVWAALSSGTSGVRPLEMFSPEGLPMKFGGEARQFANEEIANFGQLEDKLLTRNIKKGLKTICREAQMGIAAAQLAMQHAGLKAGVFSPERTGAVFGSDYMITTPEEFVDSCRQCVGESGAFEFSRWAQEGLPKLNPLWLLKYLPNMPAAHLSMYNDLRGPNNSITEREASANLAIGEAARIIARGHADCMITGATGTWVHPYKTLQAALQFELATEGDPARASRPFDLHRQGMVLGEGAAALVLEELATAQARGAAIHGEVVGSAGSQAADRNLVARPDVALANVLRGALRDAGLKPSDVGHIHAHGIATRSGDAAEARAIHAVFGKEAQRVSVVAAKSYFGNLGAGSGAVELVASLLALRHGQLFPVLNYETPDPECPLQVVRDPATPPGDVFVNANVTQQGQASCVAVRRFVA
jgi:3-oxoacyl-[acyl-carrier-protein] synthase II